MNVLDTYFAIKLDVMSIEALPVIQIYEYGSYLWSIDNPRFMDYAWNWPVLLWRTNMGQFQSDDLTNCCINACNSDNKNVLIIWDKYLMTINFLLNVLFIIHSPANISKYYVIRLIQILSKKQQVNVVELFSS